MILHKLIARHHKHRDDEGFYALQAQDAIRWMRAKGVHFGPQTEALDLGCGHGIFGVQLAQAGCKVAYADEESFLPPRLASAPFLEINLDQDEIETVGVHDLIVCSNVLEHLAKPDRFIGSVHRILRPGGHLYLSWTNWLSPWGGHEFSPFHYLGPRCGHRLYDKVCRRRRKHTPFENLFPSYIGGVLKTLRSNPHLFLRDAAPRYYTELAFIVRIPFVREFLTWNCALLIQRQTD